MKKYKIWTGNGSYPDGHVCSSKKEVRKIVKKYLDCIRMYTVEHGDGGAESCYPSLKEAREDIDGSAYAATITWRSDD